MSRGLRNNNPGNIRINSDKFQGEVIPSQDKSFKQFETMAYGYRAMFVILRNYQKKYGLRSIRDLITRWAPSNENDTEAYVKFVSDSAKVYPDVPVSMTNKSQACAIVAAMSKMENGVAAFMPDVETGFNL